MAIICPHCGSEFDVTLFEFGRRVRCHCGQEIEHPGSSEQSGHVLVQGGVAIDYVDRCIGCLLAAACGDILGAAVEGWSARDIRERFGSLRDFLDNSRGLGCYTDDTQMTLALASSLVERGALEPASVAAKYAEHYEPWRGYGGAAHRVMQALQHGADYRGTGRLQFPKGSFGNGGAMRIAPVGLVYRHATDDVLHRAVEDALLPTHIHPEAVDGAFAQAKAVTIAATTPAGALDPPMLLRLLRSASRTSVLQRKLEALSECLAHGDTDTYTIGTVGNGVRASEAVSAALWAFVRYGGQPEECIIRAAGFGGDTDTIGAMAGALVGTLHGTRWIPRRWSEMMENGRLGRDEMIALGRQLANLDLR